MAPIVGASWDLNGGYAHAKSCCNGTCPLGCNKEDEEVRGRARLGWHWIEKTDGGKGKGMGMIRVGR